MRFALVAGGRSAKAEITWDRWQTLYLFLVGALSSTILLKVAQVQYLEYLYFGQLFLLLVLFSKLGFEVTWSRALLRLSLLWMMFCVAALALAVASLRFDFYISAGLPWVRQPVYISTARDLEVFASVFSMIYIAHLFRRSENRLRFTMRVYLWAGAASAIYAIVSYPLNVLGVASLGTYSYMHRFRGFYNEGGPYGLYVISLFLVATVLRREDWEPARRIRALYFLFAIALAFSYSKAAYSACFVLLLFNVVIAGSMRKRLAVLGLAVVAIVVVSQMVPIGFIVGLIANRNTDYERVSHLHFNDPNFVDGRIAGTFIAPRMIAAHPLTGIGWGNYGTLRNSPEFRGASVWSDANDDPALGLIGYAADLGIPLVLYALFCMFVPYFMLRRARAPVYLTNLALLQPLVLTFGGQLNLTYPWIISAFALGFALRRPQFVPVPLPDTNDSLISPRLGSFEDAHG